MTLLFQRLNKATNRISKESFPWNFHDFSIYFHDIAMKTDERSKKREERERRMREWNIKRGRNASCFMRPILHRHYCRVYRAVNLPWTRLILTRAAHQIIRAETWHCGGSRRHTFPRHSRVVNRKTEKTWPPAARDERSNVGRNWNSMGDLFRRNCDRTVLPTALLCARSEKSLKRKKLSQVDSIITNQWSVRSIELCDRETLKISLNLISLMTMNTCIMKRKREWRNSNRSKLPICSQFSFWRRKIYF